MTDEDFYWRVEDACLNGRPSPIEVHHDGWLIRASGGSVRRTNSLNPTRYRSSDLPAVLDAAERIYVRLDRPTIVRVPSIASEMDDLLEGRGYAVQAESRVLLADLSATERAAHTAELTVDPPSEEWIATWATTDGTASAETVDAFRLSTAAIVLPKAFAARRVDGEIVSIAYGVLDHGLMVMEAVATRHEHRGRGHAFQTVGALMAWAQAEGTDAACLAVLADNEPALRLYRSLGFQRELYRYHYRRDDLARNNDVVGTLPGAMPTAQ